MVETRRRRTENECKPAPPDKKIKLDTLEDTKIPEKQQQQENKEEQFIPLPILENIFMHTSESNLFHNYIYVNKFWKDSIMNCANRWKFKTFRIDYLNPKTYNVMTKNNWNEACQRYFNYIYNWNRCFGKYVKYLTITGNNQERFRVEVIKELVNMLEQLTKNYCAPAEALTPRRIMTRSRSGSRVSSRRQSTGDNTSDSSFHLPEDVNLPNIFRADEVTRTTNSSTQNQKTLEPYYPEFDNRRLFQNVENFTFSAFRLNQMAWNPRNGPTYRDRIHAVLIKILGKFILPNNLKILKLNDLSLDPKQACSLILIIWKRYAQKLEVLDLEDICHERPPPFAATTQRVFNNFTMVENEDGDFELVEEEDQLVSTRNSSRRSSLSPRSPLLSTRSSNLEPIEEGEISTNPPPRNARQPETKLELFVRYQAKIPKALGQVLSNCKYLKKIYVNYSYLSENTLEQMLRPYSNFGEHLEEFHIRVDPPLANHSIFMETNQELQRLQEIYPISSPSVHQFSAISEKFPNIKFSFSFESELHYARHLKVLADPLEEIEGFQVSKPTNFRLHRLEIRGDQDLDLSGSGSENVNTTLLKILPNFSHCLKKLIISVSPNLRGSSWAELLRRGTNSNENQPQEREIYNPNRLDTGIIHVLKYCHNLQYLRFKGHLKWKTIEQMMTLIHYSNDNLTESQIKNFNKDNNQGNWPETLPIDEYKNLDLVNLPRKLKKLYITRITDRHDIGQRERDFLHDNTNRERVDNEKWFLLGDREFIRRNFPLALARLEQFYYDRRERN